MGKVAALYVQSDGCYIGLDGVDPWPESRDARGYPGPYPVVAHPPCARWGRYWYGGMFWISQGREPKKLGDDGGCFSSALTAVRRWGGVLEHPAGSHAWDAHEIGRPPISGGWVPADFHDGWTCRVEQGHYGHRGRKATYLYAVGCRDLPSLRWGPSDMPPISEAAKRADEGNIMFMSHRERAATPVPFRDVLLSIARLSSAPPPPTSSPT